MQFSRPNYDDDNNNYDSDKNPDGLILLPVPASEFSQM